jgi:cytochrome b pre-mRNA-processing protein 3
VIASIFKKIFASDPLQLPAHNAYIALVNQARKSFFYQEYGVSDNLDGRFDVIVLHMFLLTKRLKVEAPEFLRALWEVFFSDMDRSLREMGASDTGIGKRVKKMVQAFYGRIDSYEKTLADDGGFKEALRRNLYRGAEVSDLQLENLAAYVKRNLEYLEKQEISSIVGGDLSFCS